MQSQSARILENILSDLPKRPYCANDLSKGLLIRSLEKALEYNYIQLNPPAKQHYLIFDIDKKAAAIEWEYSKIAPPNYVVINPNTTHGHAVYKLETPVVTTQNGKLEPLRYAAAIELAYTTELGADLGYSGLISRNPYQNPVRHIHSDQYSLFELEDYLPHPLSHYKRPLAPINGLGRNVTLFDDVRAWAYTAIRLYRTGSRPRLYDVWLKEVTEYTERKNSQFMNPLAYSEVKATARSIAKFCWKHDPQAEQQFLMRQAERGRLGGKAKGLANAAKRIQAVEMSLQGMTQTEIALELGVHRNTVRNYLMHK